FRFIFSSGKKNDAEAAQNCVKNRTKNLANAADKENGTHIREDEEQNLGLDYYQFLGNQMNTQSARRSSALLTGRSGERRQTAWSTLLSHQE
ncbi:MAG: hypothetical protein ACPGYJ_09330, partial [bacterium]